MELFSGNGMYSLIFQRYMVFGILGIEALLVPMLLEAKFYGQFEYIRSLVFLSQFAYLGACSGYITIYFKYDVDLLGDLQFIAACCGLIVFFAALLLSASISIGVSCVAIIIAFYLETIAKLNKNFLVAIIYKPLFSFFILIIAVALWNEEISPENPDYIVAICSILSLISYLLISNLAGVKRLTLPKINIDIRNVKRLIKEGFIINAATALIMLNVFSDRSWIKIYYIDHLPDYSFAMNISQFVILAITTFSLVNQVELGESFKSRGLNGLLEELKKKLVFSAKVYVVLICLYLPFLYILSHFISFPHFTTFAIATGILFGLSQLLFSINIALVYISKFHIAASLCLGALLLNIAIDYLLSSFEFPPIWLLISSYVSFILVGVIIITYLIKSNCQQPEREMPK